MASTIWQCFYQPHPEYVSVNQTESEHRDATASSAFTKGQDPPKVLINRPPNYWTSIADTFLLSHPGYSDLTQNFAAPYIPSALENEGDVVRLAGRHLMDPVMMALQVILPVKLQEHAQVELDGLRPDVAIKTTNANSKIIALVEYKRCGYVLEKEFSSALYDDASDANIQQVINSLYSKGRSSTVVEDSNALVFLKQITAYHDFAECNYVALCDYEHLILVKYRGNGNLESAHVTIVPRSDFRRALLGFMMEAGGYVQPTS